MRVHKDFKKWCDKLRENNKTLSSVDVTELIIKHNASEIIKQDIKEFRK